MPRLREILAAAVLAGGGLLMAFLAVELGVRWMRLVPDRFWEPDPLLGVRLVAGASGWWTQEEREFVVPVQINAAGRRDVERPEAKPPATVRVLVLGDSFVEALHVPMEAIFPRQLEVQLNRDGRGPRTEVLSAGVSGYGTASEALYFERDGRRLAPDLVLLAFYPGNDVKNNSPTLEDTLPPVYAADGTLDRVGHGRRKREVGGRLGSHAYEYVRQLVLLRHPALAQTLAERGLVRRDALRPARLRDGVPVDYGVYAASVDAEWADAWGRTESLLERLRASSVAAGAGFAVVILSTRDQVYPESWAQIVAANPGMQGRQWDLDGPQRRVEQWCAARGVPCLAMAPVFRAAATAGSEPLHFPRDGHWTVAGHRLGAEEMANFIERHRLVPPAKGRTES